MERVRFDDLMGPPYVLNNGTFSLEEA
jgi:hypothetical protein